VAQLDYGEVMAETAKSVPSSDESHSLGEGQDPAPAPPAAATMLKAEVTAETIEAIDETAAATGTCGDAKREGNEECDDGNTDPNDGCSAICKVEGGYQCLPLEVNGKDMCVACGDNQCTTFFSLQSRCMDTGSGDEMAQADMATEMAAEKKTPNAQEAEAAEPPVDMMTKLKSMNLDFATFLETSEGSAGAFERGANGFCECSPNYCKLPTSDTSFVCKSTAKGWARKSLTDPECACAPGFCSMPLAQLTPTQYHCTPLHDAMIRNNETGVCECRGAVAAVESSDPSLAVTAKDAACKIVPEKAVETVPGGADKFGEFECVGTPYVKAAGTDQCESCADTSCQMDRTQGTGNFFCFEVVNGSSATVTAPYAKKPDGKCECGADQCLMPNGDHEVCRDLANAYPYGPMKHSDGKCGCSADQNVCKLAITGGFRCVHITQDNFARNYRRAPNGDCECASQMCIGSPHPDNGALQCEDASADSAYQRTTGTFQCECKPGSCKFPNGVCKICPTIPGHCESMCHEATETEVQCVKFCRTKNIEKKMVRSTAQGQLQSVKKTTAREIGCFVQKVTTCSITTNAKSCTQIKSAKALYDCPAAKSGSEPMRLRDGTETYGYTSMCDRTDLECQIQNCGRAPDSNLCQKSLLLV